jgi:hypothetical protein
MNMIAFDSKTGVISYKDFSMLQMSVLGHNSHRADGIPPDGK